MSKYQAFYRRSLDDREGFWAEQAELIEWQKPFDQVLDYSNPPFAKWYVGGKTNICHNAVDRHLKDRANQQALVAVSTETNIEKTYTFKELHTEVNRMAAILKAHGVVKGDRVLIYMPMIAEAAFAMLACVRVGAIHSVVFGGFASHSLASRIDDAKPKMVILAVAAFMGSIGSFLYVFRPLAALFLGQEFTEYKKVKEAPILMLIPTFIIMGLNVYTGIFPAGILKFINNIITQSF